jgi:hypothetical protein
LAAGVDARAYTDRPRQKQRPLANPSNFIRRIFQGFGNNPILEFRILEKRVLGKFLRIGLFKDSLADIESLKFADAPFSSSGVGRRRRSEHRRHASAARPGRLRLPTDHASTAAASM